jgi:hypothetical protein
MAAVVEMLSVAEPDLVIDAGPKLAVAPLGNPLALSETVPPNPFSAPTEIAKLVLPPAVTFCEAGVAVIEKSGFAGPLTVKLTLAL